MQAMREDGIRVETRVIPDSLEKTDDGILMHAEDGRDFSDQWIACLWAIGREPNTEGPGPGESRRSQLTSEWGFVPVDDFQHTNVESIYAD